MVCWMWARSHKITSLSSWLSGVEFFLKQNSQPRLPRFELFKDNKDLLELVFEQEDEERCAHAVSEQEVTVMIELADDGSLVGRMLACMLAFAFAGLLRASEYCRMIRGKDVTVEDWGVQLVIPFSKTDTRPATVFLPRTGDGRCPKRALARYLELYRRKGRAPATACAANESLPIIG